MTVPEKFVSFLETKRGCWLVLGTVLLATCLSAGLGALKFSSNTVDDYTPSSNLKSYDDFVAFENKFPDFIFVDVEVVLIERTDGKDIVTPTAAEICGKLNQSLSTELSFAVRSFDWYFAFNTTTQESLAEMYISSDRSSMLFAITMDIRGDTSSFVQTARDLVDSLDSEYEDLGYSLTMTGKLTATQINDKKTGKGFALSDGSGLPVIAIIFWYEVGSIRLLLIPVAALGCALMVSWAIGNSLAVHNHVKIPSYEPNIMLFLCMAMSIDYSFFLLTRFQEERRERSETLSNAVVAMMKHSGSIVLVSGSILVVTWLALCFFPVYGLNAVGYCSAVAIFVCIVMNLLLAPSLLIAFPNFFGKAGFSIMEDLRKCCGCCCSDSRKSRASTVADDNEKPDKHVNGYHRIARVVTTFPWSIIVPLCVYIVFVLGCVLLRDFSFSIGTTVSFGSGSAADTYKSLFGSFPSGVFAASFGILGAHSSDQSTATVFTDEYFAASCSIASQLNNVAHVMPESVQGITFAQTQGAITCLNASIAEQWVQSQSDSSAEADTYRWWFSRLTPKVYGPPAPAVAGLTTFSVDFNPYSTGSKSVVHTVRRILDAQNKIAEASNSDLRFYLYHPIVSEVDAEEFALARFPFVLVGTLLVIFLLISLRFRAAFVPFKLCLTIVVPILFVFGLAVGVYKKGALNFLGIDAFKGTGGISWLVPCATIFLLIGLAIDYDIFLFSRVYELRKTGLTTQNAIIQAVTITGPIISGAGVIMALAFTGMVASTNEFLNEQGFIMILGVLVDTYIVRVVLVPSVLSLGGWTNWWPVKMPTPMDSSLTQRMLQQDP